MSISGYSTSNSASAPSLPLPHNKASLELSYHGFPWLHCHYHLGKKKKKPLQKASMTYYLKEQMKRVLKKKEKKPACAVK